MLPAKDKHVYHLNRLYDPSGTDKVTVGHLHTLDSLLWTTVFVRLLSAVTLKVCWHLESKQVSRRCMSKYIARSQCSVGSLLFSLSAFASSIATRPPGVGKHKVNTTVTSLISRVPALSSDADYLWSMLARAFRASGN